MASEIWSSTFGKGNLVVDIGRVTFQVIFYSNMGSMDCSQGFLLPLLLATIQDHPNLFPVVDSIWTTLTILVILAIFNAHMHT